MSCAVTTREKSRKITVYHRRNEDCIFQFFRGWLDLRAGSRGLAPVNLAGSEHMPGRPHIHAQLHGAGLPADSADCWPTSGPRSGPL